MCKVHKTATETIFVTTIESQNISSIGIDCKHHVYPLLPVHAQSAHSIFLCSLWRMQSCLGISEHWGLVPLQLFHATAWLIHTCKVNVMHCMVLVLETIPELSGFLFFRYSFSPRSGARLFTNGSSVTMLRKLHIHSSILWNKIVDHGRRNKIVTHKITYLFHRPPYFVVNVFVVPLHLQLSFYPWNNAQSWAICTYPTP